jgi:hypothetical protein
MTGGPGLAMILPVSAWIAYLAVVVWRSGRKDRAIVLLGMALLPVAYLALYFNGYHRPAEHPPLSRDPVGVGSVTGAVLSLAPGIGLSPAWWAVCIGELALCGWTVALLVRRGWAESPSTVGLLAVAIGVVGVALAIGLARAEWGADRVLLFARYSLLTWPLLAIVYLVWVKLGRKWVPIALCVVAALAFPGNTGTGMVNGAVVKSDYAAIEADVATGLSAEEIVNEKDERRRFPKSHQGAQRERAIRAIPLLRQARIGIFAGK